MQGHVSGLLVRRGAVVSVGLWRARRRQALRHYDFRSAGLSRDNVELVHERAHEENPAAGSAEKIFFGERIGNIGELESGAFIGYVNDHFFGSEIDGEMNFLVGLFLIAVMKGVDHAFAHAHANAITLVFAKARGFGKTKAHFFSQVDAFDLSFERDFQMLGFWSHSPRRPQKKAYFLQRLWVTQRKRPRQWRVREEG